MRNKFEIRRSEMGAFAYLKDKNDAVHEYDMFGTGIDLMLAEGHDWDTIVAAFELVFNEKKQKAA